MPLEAQRRTTFICAGVITSRSSICAMRKKPRDISNRHSELDPSFSLAHSGLVDTQMVFVLSGDVAASEVSSTVTSAIAQALRLDPESAEAHTADSTTKLFLDWDFKARSWRLVEPSI